MLRWIGKMHRHMRSSNVLVPGKRPPGFEKGCDVAAMFELVVWCAVEQDVAALISRTLVGRCI